MDYVKTIFESVADIIEKEYPYVWTTRFDGMVAGTGHALAGNYLLAVSYQCLRMEIHFDDEGIMVDLESEIEYENPNMLGIICGKLYDKLGVRPENPAFTVGL